MQGNVLIKKTQQLGLLLISFLDDIVLFVFSRIGLHWAWLHWLSTILLIATLSYWAYRLLRYCCYHFGYLA